MNIPLFLDEGGKFWRFKTTYDSDRLSGKYDLSAGYEYGQSKEQWSAYQ